MDQSNKPPVPSHILNMLSRWRLMARIVQLLNLLLGFFAISCSLAVTTFAGELSTLQIRCLAFIGTLSATCIFAFDTTQKAKSILRAWRVLTSAVLLYQYNQESKIEDVIKKYEECEHELGQITISIPEVVPPNEKRNSKYRK